MAERPEHRIGERAFVPGAFIPATIDEKGWHHLHTAATCAFNVLTHMGLSRDKRWLVVNVARQIEITCDLTKVALCEHRPTLHQRFVNLPEFTGRFRRVFRQLC